MFMTKLQRLKICTVLTTENWNTRRLGMERVILLGLCRLDTVNGS